MASSVLALGALVLAAAGGTGCSSRNAEPPYLQISRQALSDLPCADAIHVDEIADIFAGSDPEFCAYGCGRSQRYACSDASGDCYETWPSICY